MTKSVYLNLEDDVAKVVARIKKAQGNSLVLVCPKRCQLFSDSINLRLLKKQVDLLGKEAAILTMDEKGQLYAKEAGFKLKFLPKQRKSQGFSDIRVSSKQETPQQQVDDQGIIGSTVKEITTIAKKITGSQQKEGRQKKAKAKKPSEPKVSARDTFFPAELDETYKMSKKKKHNQRLITLLVAISLVVILAVVLVILPKATVTIFPKTEPISRDLEISISTNSAQPDSARLILPAVLVNESFNKSFKFQSQGKKQIGNEAEGLIRVYNFTGEPINLRKETTVLNVGSRNYTLAEDIVLLKPTRYQDSQTKEIDERSLAEPVAVIASEGGENFNLPAGTRMEITNQVFGSRPQILYAKTETEITGGTSRFLSIVSNKDIEDGKTKLEELVMQELRENLQEQNLVLIEKAFNAEVLDYTTDKKVDSESPSFTASLSWKVEGLAFNYTDLQDLIMDRINQTLPSDKLLQAEPWDLANVRVKNLDLEAGLGVLFVHFEGKMVSQVNIESIPPQLVGKDLNQVNEILQSKSQIERIDVNLAPSWQKNFPWFQNKIEVIFP